MGLAEKFFVVLAVAVDVLVLLFLRALAEHVGRRAVERRGAEAAAE